MLKKKHSLEVRPGPVERGEEAPANDDRVGAQLLDAVLFATGQCGPPETFVLGGVAGYGFRDGAETGGESLEVFQHPLGLD